MMADEEEIIAKVMNNLRTDGFFQIQNVEGYDEGELFTTIKALFHKIPAAEQRKLLWKNFNPDNENVFRGKSKFLPNSVS